MIANVRIIQLISFFLLITLIASSSSASIFMNTRDKNIKRGELIEDDIYLFGDYSEIRGDVDGDVSAFIYDYIFSGSITGNLNLFSYDADIRGNIDQTARIFVYNCNIDATIGRNLVIVGNSVRILQETHIGRDLTFAGDRLVLSGIVDGNADIHGNTVAIKGQINGNLIIKANNVNILSPAHILGDVTYTSQAEAEIEDGVIIEGEVIWNEPLADPGDYEDGSAFDFVISLIFFLLSLTTGIALILVFKRHTREASTELCRKPLMTFAVGMASLAAAIVGSIVMFALIVGIPISLIMASLGLTLLYIGKVYTSIALGRFIFRPFSAKTVPMGVELLLGLIILTILFQLPFIGWPIYIITAIIGMGAAISGFMVLCRRLENVETSPDNLPPVT